MRDDETGAGTMMTETTKLTAAQAKAIEAIKANGGTTIGLNQHTHSQGVQFKTVWRLARLGLVRPIPGTDEGDGYSEYQLI